VRLRMIGRPSLLFSKPSPVGRPPAFDPEWGRVTKPRVGRVFGID